MTVPKTWTTNELLTAADLNASAASTAWTAVTYTNSWVDVAGGFQTVQYRKVGDEVQIRGQMKSGTVGLAAFTLPSGFRCVSSMQYPTDANGAHGQLLVQNSGAITVAVAASTANVGVNISYSVTT